MERFLVLALTTGFVCLLGATPALANSPGVYGKPTVKPQSATGSPNDAFSTTIGGGVNVLPTTRTVTHWWGSTTDPDNGVTYGYNMVGADPHSFSGSGCSA